CCQRGWEYQKTLITNFSLDKTHPPPPAPPPASLPAHSAAVHALTPPAPYSHSCDWSYSPSNQRGSVAPLAPQNRRQSRCYIHPARSCGSLLHQLPPAGE